jgi:hypothetical protein
MIWEHRDDHDLDTIDGTFYWRGCRWEIFEPLLEGARTSHAAKMALSNLIPEFGISQGGRPVSEWRIPMRGAIPSVQSIYTGHSKGLRGNVVPRLRATVQVKIRNQEWKGADVANAIHRAWDDYCEPHPPDNWPDNAKHMGIGAPEHITLDMVLKLPPDVQLVNYGDVEALREIVATWEEGDAATLIHLPFPGWLPEPCICVEVSTPPPAMAVITAWFDDVAIARNEWTGKLRGATNGQDVSTAIRTWAALLLYQYGLSSDDARWEVKDITGKLQNKSSYHSSVDLIKDRVPELRDWLDARPVRSRKT